MENSIQPHTGNLRHFNKVTPYSRSLGDSCLLKGIRQGFTFRFIPEYNETLKKYEEVVNAVHSIYVAEPHQRATYTFDLSSTLLPCLRSFARCLKNTHQDMLDRINNSEYAGELFLEIPSVEILIKNGAALERGLMKLHEVTVIGYLVSTSQQPVRKS